MAHPRKSEKAKGAEAQCAWGRDMWERQLATSGVQMVAHEPEALERFKEEWECRTVI